MTSPILTKAGVELTPRLYEEAYKRGMTLSAFLEKQDPSSEYNASERATIGRDAFSRLLRHLDIRTRSIPEMGVRAHEVGRFFEGDDEALASERAVLFPEWISRQYRRHARVTPRNGQSAMSYDGGRERFMATNAPLSDALYPEAIADEMRWQRLEPSLLSTLVAMTRTIDSDRFTAFYLNDADTEAGARMKRITEYGEIPVTRIQGSDQTIRAYKYGRAIQASYESIRRVSLDLMAWWIQYVAAKAEADKFLTAVDVLVNGDGNTGTAATNTNGSTLDSGAAGDLTLKMWLKFGMLWSAPYQANVAIGQDEAIAKLLLLQAGSANLPPQQLVTASGAIGQVTLARPIYGGMVAINEATAPANKLLVLDNRFTLEMVMEAGTDLVETDRLIRKQFEEIVISEVVGFDILTKGQNRTLDYTA